MITWMSLESKRKMLTMVHEIENCCKCGAPIVWGMKYWKNEKGEFLCLDCMEKKKNENKKTSQSS